jgi:hypothetical protein
MGNIMQQAKSKMKKAALVTSGLVVGATGLGLTATTMASADSWNNGWSNNNWGNNSWNNGWNDGWNNSWNNNWNWNNHRNDHRFFTRHVFDNRVNRVVIIVIDVFTGNSWTQW